MAKVQGLGLDVFCEALGVERPTEVTRVVVDIRAGHRPMLYVERIGDAHKIVAALREPGIDVEFQAPTLDGIPGVDTTTLDGRREHVGPVVHGNVSGANIAWGNGNVTQRS